MKNATGCITPADLRQRLKDGRGQELDAEVFARRADVALAPAHHAAGPLGGRRVPVLSEDRARIEGPQEAFRCPAAPLDSS